VLQGQILTPKISQQLTLLEMSTPAVQNMTGSIALGLSKVPAEHHMDCLMFSPALMNLQRSETSMFFYI